MSIAAVVVALLYRLTADPGHLVVENVIPPETEAVLAAALIEPDGVALQVSPSGGTDGRSEAAMPVDIELGREASLSTETTSLAAAGRSTGVLSGSSGIDSQQPNDFPTTNADAGEETTSTARPPTSKPPSTTSPPGSSTAASRVSMETTTTSSSSSTSTTTTTEVSTTATTTISTTTEGSSDGGQTTTSPPPAAVGPIAVDDSVSGDDGKDLKVKVMENDRERGAPLDKDTLVIVSSPAHAESFRVHGDHIHYKSIDGFSGTDRLRYRICDEQGSCAEATVVVTVTP